MAVLMILVGRGGDGEIVVGACGGGGGGGVCDVDELKTVHPSTWAQLLRAKRQTNSNVNSFTLTSNTNAIPIPNPTLTLTLSHFPIHLPTAPFIAYS